LSHFLKNNKFKINYNSYKNKKFKMNNKINIEQSKIDKLKILISELEDNIFRIKSTKNNKLLILKK
jgi:anti-sigma regulatory factor (Ser/Thr protein kinase)